MPNMFDVAPAGENLQSGLAGLGNLIRERKQQDKEQQAIQKAKDEQNAGLTALAGAYRSGDPSQLAQVAINHPAVMNQAKAAMGLMDESRNKEYQDDAMAFLTNPDDAAAAQALSDRISRLKAQGRDTTHSEALLEHMQQDPAAARKEAEMHFAVTNPEAHKQVVDVLRPKPILVPDDTTAITPEGKTIFTAPAKTPEAMKALQQRAKAAGLVEGTSEYQSFMLYGGKPEETPAFRALKERAEAAGLKEGTPEFQQFMKTNGAASAQTTLEGD